MTRDRKHDTEPGRPPGRWVSRQARPAAARKAAEARRAGGVEPGAASHRRAFTPTSGKDLLARDRAVGVDVRNPHGGSAPAPRHLTCGVTAAARFDHPTVDDVEGFGFRGEDAAVRRGTRLPAVARRGATGESEVVGLDPAAVAPGGGS